MGQGYENKSGISYFKDFIASCKINLRQIIAITPDFTRWLALKPVNHRRLLSRSLPEAECASKGIPDSLAPDTFRFCWRNRVERHGV